MASRQPKPGSATKGSRQRLLKPLESLHGQSPLRRRLSVHETDRFNRKTPSRPSRNNSREIKNTNYREAEGETDDSSEVSNNDKENVNPRQSPAKRCRARVQGIKEPLMEIILKYDDHGEAHDSFVHDKNDTAYSDFREIDSEEDDSISNLWNSIGPKGIKKATAPKTFAQREEDQSPPAKVLEAKTIGSEGTELEKALLTLTLEDSPKRDINARALETGERPATPKKVSSPSKSLLKSPSKSPRKVDQERIIPPTPHRASLDAFWSQEAVNSWNDEFSPKKVIGPPRKGALQRMLEEVEGWSNSEEDEEDLGGSRTRDEVPQSPVKSPTKKQLNQQVREAKNAAKAAKEEFLNSREALATAFLEELDSKVAGGKIADLTQTSGGVKILWSVTLRSTAGRANWRREAIRRLDGGMPVKLGSDASDTVMPGQKSLSTVHYRHVAYIELATKVITTKDRLLNVIAHEFCHLANFMISNVKDQPHGKSFKQWASKVTREFGDRGVVVTTKHDWEVDYKYEWVCAGRLEVKNQQHDTDADIEALMHQLALDRGELTMDDGGCGTLYQRHSKSVDPSKHRCGKCKGKLVQTKPAPRMRREK